MPSGECSPRYAAKKLDVHIDTIYRWCHEGRLAYRKTIAGRYRLKKSEIFLLWRESKKAS